MLSTLIYRKFAQHFNFDAAALAYIKIPVETDVQNSGEWYKIEGIYNYEQLSRFEIVSEDVCYCGTFPRKIAVWVVGSINSDTINVEMTIAIFKNGTLQVNSMNTNRVESVGATVSIATIDIVEFKEGDNFELKIKANKACKLTALTLTVAATSTLLQ